MEHIDLLQQKTCCTPSLTCHPLTYLFGAATLLLPLAYFNKKIKLKTFVIPTALCALATGVSATFSTKNGEEEEIPQGQAFNSVQEFKDFLENFSDASTKSFNFSAILNKNIKEIFNSLAQLQHQNPSNFQIFWGTREPVILEAGYGNDEALWMAIHAPQNANLSFK
ncbi:MAG: hypothetical protein JSR80_00960 [Verrucomicrobia bacterium]|nr:hypothetical protein [Verrucomicrobiota bacterium]